VRLWVGAIVLCPGLVVGGLQRELRLLPGGVGLLGVRHGSRLLTGDHHLRCTACVQHRLVVAVLAVARGGRRRARVALRVLSHDRPTRVLRHAHVRWVQSTLRVGRLLLHVRRGHGLPVRLGQRLLAVDRRGVMGRLAKAGGRGVEAAGRGQVLGVHGGCFCCGRREGAVGRLVALLRPDEVELPAALVLLLREDTHLAEALASAARVALAGDLGLVALLAGLLSKATRF